MSDESGKPLPEAALGARREVTIEALMEHFANDDIVVEEFERRVEAAHKATDADELRALLTDLPGADLPAALSDGGELPSHRSRPRVTAGAHEKEQEYIIAVMGGSGRSGRWTPARVNWVVGVMGGSELDLREAHLPSGVTEIRAFLLMGGLEIIVPPGVRVESNGFAFMGGFDHSDEESAGPPDPDFDAPVIRITGAVVMGGVDVTFRYPGESGREARRRRRLERKERRRLERGR